MEPEADLSYPIYVQAGVSESCSCISLDLTTATQVRFVDPSGYLLLLCAQRYILLRIHDSAELNAAGIANLFW
ncbi:hypothetical protein B0G38_000628 [Arthrobacter sp. VKM Ac-2550]|nr:hypothetical protein [Arthrobacter sp. VKM Ac-2550]